VNGFAATVVEGSASGRGGWIHVAIRTRESLRSLRRKRKMYVRARYKKIAVCLKCVNSNYSFVMNGSARHTAFRECTGAVSGDHMAGPRPQRGWIAGTGWVAGGDVVSDRTRGARGKVLTRNILGYASTSTPPGVHHVRPRRSGMEAERCHSRAPGPTPDQIALAPVVLR